MRAGSMSGLLPVELELSLGCGKLDHTVTCCCTLAHVALHRTTIIHVIFSYVGMDIVAATAAESKSLPDAESMKLAARKINIRIVSLYSIAMLTASFMVPMNHPFINGGAQSVGESSIFIIAVVEAGIPSAAHFFNAIFVFSSFTCAINSMYVGSRVLYTLALQGQTGPEFITRRLRQCHWGVPTRSVLMTGCLMMMAFMGSTGAPGMVSTINTWARPYSITLSDNSNPRD